MSKERIRGRGEGIPGNPEEEDIAPFRGDTISGKIAEGSHAAVHEVHHSREYVPPLVVKIGNTTEYAPPLLKALRITFPRPETSRFLEKYLGKEFKIMPDEELVRNGVAEYVQMKKYFGYEPRESPAEGEESAPDSREELVSQLRNPEDSFSRELRNIIGRSERFETAIQSVQHQRNENFLPREQVVIGHPRETTRADVQAHQQSGEKLPMTYYLLQERIAGDHVKPLAELTDQDLRAHPQLIERLLTFAVLTKKMYADTGKLIDTRPEEVLKHPFEWFQKTANILVNLETEKVFFVDSRWLWDKDSAMGAGKGKFTLIDLLGVKSVDRAIRKYAGLLGEAGQ